jgi:hypothetical protein
VLKKKIWANFQRVLELYTQKLVNKLSKIWVWDPGSEIRDPGSEIRDPEKNYSGSRIQGSKRHRIPDPDPQHYLKPRKKIQPRYSSPTIFSKSEAGKSSARTMEEG